MDNLAHTLAGLAIAEAGLRGKAALGATTLAIAANLPDIDALIYFFGDGPDALAFRRGWTHGILAMVVLPILLAMAMRGVTRFRQSRPDMPAASWRWLIILSAVGVWSHPLLDLLNTYGVRLLMPFSNRWFYGDALFIIDVWLWLVLVVGIFLSRRRALRLRPHPERPARTAIALLAMYIIAMAVSSRTGRSLVEQQATGGAADRVMVSPVPLTPLRRMVVRDLGDRYDMGELVFGETPMYRPIAQTRSGRDTELAVAAARTPDGAAFLSWSRFPRFAVEPGRDPPLVRISDMRYADVRGRGWASIVVRIPPGRGRSGLTGQ